MTVVLPLAAAEADGWVDLPFVHPARLTLVGAGDMRSLETRCAALEAMGFDPASVCMVRQTHSRIVRHADELLAVGSSAASGTRIEGDGIVSAPGGPVLAVGVGDCMPVLIADERTGAYAIVHSGWRGTGILRDAVEAMARRYGTECEDLRALYGPCISGDSYAVDAARGRDYARWGSDAVVWRGEQAYLDMRAANLAIARDLGIRAAVVDHCTVLTPQLGSFRREGPGYHGMLALIGPSPAVGRAIVREDESDE